MFVTIPCISYQSGRYWLKIHFRSWRWSDQEIWRSSPTKDHCRAEVAPTTIITDSEVFVERYLHPIRTLTNLRRSSYAAKSSSNAEQISYESHRSDAVHEQTRRNVRYVERTNGSAVYTQRSGTKTTTRKPRKPDKTSKRGNNLFRATLTQTSC